MDKYEGMLSWMENVLSEMRKRNENLVLVVTVSKDGECTVYKPPIVTDPHAIFILDDFVHHEYRLTTINKID